MKYIMSNKEMGRLTAIKGAIDGAYTVRGVARRLGISERRVKQLKRQVRTQGVGAVIHGNSGRCLAPRETIPRTCMKCGLYNKIEPVLISM
ncbi:hypothetical protein AGMMS50267_16830 [Spirochaetia bacterium]|nr:hypothetical protein AGMMS50267_16830 [Spirochaetia bacterium]